MKNERGITLVTLVTTIIILLILTGVTISVVNMINAKDQIKKMNADIQILQDKVILYYNKNQELPITQRSIELFEPSITYWEIDLNKISVTGLNFGHDFGKDGDLEFNVSDVYVINNNFEIVYLRGINYNGRTYYQNETDKKSGG